MTTLAACVYAVFLAYQSLADGGAWQCGGAAVGFDVRLSRTDLVANVVAYVPLGLLCALAARGRLVRQVVAGFALPTALSLVLELVQSCQAARVSSAWDWSANTAGAAFGVMAAMVVDALRARGAVLGGRAPTERTTLRLLTAGVALGWVVSQTAPWVFAVDVGTVRGNLSFLKRALADPALDPFHVARHAGAWLAVACACRLWAGRGDRAAAVLATVAGLSLGLQLLLDVSRPLSLDELVGMLPAAGLGAALALSPAGRRAGAVPSWALGLFWGAWLACAAYQLRPDPGGAGPAANAAFHWWPRVGLGGLRGALDYALLFGWFGVAAGAADAWRAIPPAAARHRLAAVAVGSMFLLELVQTTIPGRGPDLSAPLFTGLGVLMAWAILRPSRT